MQINSCKQYRKALADLWHRVFGDDYDYINLIFKSEFDICDTFIKELDGKIVSAFYLLNCNLIYDNTIYKGKYLYAAATDPLYRKKGFMSELIREALSYCENSADADFVCLVPANEKLYSYYASFGFQTAMYRYESKINGNEACLHRDGEFFGGSEKDFLNLRNYFNGNRIQFEQKDFQYVLECFENTAEIILLNQNKGYFIRNKDEKNVVSEFIAEEKTFKNSVEEMLSCFSGEIKLYSPYELSSCGESCRKKYGMIYPADKNLKRKWSFEDVYMNLALD